MGHPPPLHSPHLRSPAVFVFQVPPIEEGFDDPKHSLKPWDAKKVGAGWGGVTQCGFFGGGGNSKASNASHAWLLLLPVPAALQHGHQRLPDGKGGEGDVGRGGLWGGGGAGAAVAAALHCCALLWQLNSSSARPRSCEVPGIQ